MTLCGSAARNDVRLRCVAGLRPGPWYAFSSFGVLACYAVANAAARTLTPAEGRPARVIPVAGAAGCLALAFALPPASVLWGTAVLALGAGVYGVRGARARRTPGGDARR